MTAGGMFCLFTSHRALNNGEQWCKRHKTVLGGRKLLVQGDAPRDDLLRRFRDAATRCCSAPAVSGRASMCAGSALTIVAIDKLPFASPADPLMMARLEYIRRQGGNGFHGAPAAAAVLALKQGAGRLLRDQNDYGVIVLCDPRTDVQRLWQDVSADVRADAAYDLDFAEVSRFLAAHERRGGSMKLLALDTSSLACSVALQVGADHAAPP